MVLLRIVAFPDGSEHFLRHPTVKHRHTIDLLTGVAGEGGHTETLSMIIRIRATHANELIPCDAQLRGIAAHVLAEEALVEVVVTCRHWGVDGIK
jgi:hypothetical protein